VTIHGLSMTRRVRSVQRCSSGTRGEVLGFATGASDHAPRGAARREGLIGHQGASSHMRPDASGRRNRSLDPFCTQTGRRVSRVRLVLQRVRSVLRGRRRCAICASGLGHWRVRSLGDRWGAESTVEIWRSTLNAGDTWTAQE
jgi:hypothetical protein